MSKSRAPAHPVQELNFDGSHFVTHLGLTKREYFAGLAMQALISTASEACGRWQPEDAAFESVEYANALLAELGKGVSHD